MHLKAWALLSNVAINYSVSHTEDLSELLKTVWGFPLKNNTCFIYL